MYAAPRWPLTLTLYATRGGNQVYTFRSPEGLNLSDNARGFESLSGFQEMQAWEAFWLYDLAPAKWLVLACGGLPVWEGRLEDRKVEPGGFSFTALGAKRALDDVPYTALWSTMSYAGMKPVTTEEITKAAPARWAMDNNNRIWFGLVNGETYNNDDHYGLLVFRNPHRGEQKIKQLTYTYDYTLPTNWKLEIMGYDEGFVTGAVEQTYTGDGANHTGSGTVSLSTSKDFLVFRVRNATGGNVTFASATGSSYAKLTSLRVKGTTSASLYADEVAKALVDFITKVNANQLADSYAGLQSPAKDLEDVVYEDMTPAAVLEDLIARGDSQTPPRKWEWGVWEGQRLYFQPQGTNAKTWYVEVDEDFTLDSTLETLVNQAYALYQDANGRRLRTTVATDADSYNQYGLYRRGVAQAGQTTSQTTAQKSRDTLLNEQATIAPRAQLRLFGLYEAASGGPPLPLWLLRSWDTVVIRNLPPTLSTSIDRLRRFRVVRKVYEVDQDVLTPTPEYPLPGLEIQVASALSTSQGNVPGLGWAAEVVPPSITPVFV